MEVGLGSMVVVLCKSGVRSMDEGGESGREGGDLDEEEGGKC